MRRTIFGNVRENNNTNDRLSELPDGILTHILSFLDTKYAVQTSSLSKRWINLWISVTNLNFHCSSFRTLTAVQHFIGQVLMRRDNSVSLNRFVFNCKRTITFKCFENVINYATSNGVKHLEVRVCISARTICSIPNCIFLTVTLRTLKLKCTGYCRGIQTPFSFAQLQTLSLDGILFEGSDLFWECPNLVELSIIDCVVNYCSNELIISAPQLERLNISLCVDFSLISKIVLSSPKLTLFNLKARNPVLLQTDELVHLRTATIDFGSNYGFSVKEYGRTMMKLLQKLHNGEHVTLSIPTIELLYVITGLLKNPPSPFDNLKSLKIIAGTLEQPFHNYGLILPHKRISLNVLNQVMNFLLQNSPQAEIVLELPRY